MAPGYLAAAGQNEIVRRVLDLLGRGLPNLGWSELYKVYELVERHVNDHAGTMSTLAPQATRSAFTGSANLYSVSGDAARHAVNKGSKPPKHTFTIHQGRSMIRQLVADWMKTS